MKDGNLFWSGPKRCPHPIKFDPSNDVHVLFIQACANLIAGTIGIKHELSKDVVRKLAEEVKVPEFRPRQDIKIELEKKPEEEKKQEDNATEDDYAILDELIKEVAVDRIGVKSSDFHPADFEKDDDSNFHIDFIHAAAQLRAENYGIPKCERQNTKMIAGKIIPAIATTTAMITGAVMFELYKVVQGRDKIEDYRNAFINLGVSLFVFTEPTPPKKH